MSWLTGKRSQRLEDVLEKPNDCHLEDSETRALMKTLGGQVCDRKMVLADKLREFGFTRAAKELDTMSEKEHEEFVAAYELV